MQNQIRLVFFQIYRLSPTLAITSIAILSVSVKLFFIIFFGGGWNTFPTEGSDALFYHNAALNLLQTGVYSLPGGSPTTEMPPGQSFFLALLYGMSGNSFAFAKLAHVAILTLAAILTFLTGKQLANAQVGFWSGVLIAIDPAQAYLSATFLSEPLFIFWMVLGIYLLTRHRKHEQIGWLIAVGICFGLAGLTRNQGWLYAIFLWGGALVTLGRLISIRAATIVLFTTAITIAPWTYRNYVVSGEFNPVSHEGGLTLWSSNNPEFVWRQPMPMSLPIYARPEGLSGNQIDRYYRQKAIDWILGHPMEFVVNGFRKVIVLYSFDPLSWRPEVAGLYRIAGLIPYGLMLPSILVGLVAHARESKLRVILWYILFTTLMAILFFGDSRIRAPIQPYLYLFGVLGMQGLVDWWRRRNQPFASSFP